MMSIRAEIRAGRWLGRVPGVREVGARLKVSKNTVTCAFDRLVAEKWLCKTGRGRRLIPGPAWPETAGPTPTKIKILSNKGFDQEGAIMWTLLFRLREEIERTGRECEFAGKTQAALKYDPIAILRYMEQYAGTSWIIVGAGRDLLEAVAQRKIHAFALGGNSLGCGLPGTGHDVTAAMRQLVNHLTGLGHRRIVFIAPAAILNRPHGRLVTAFAEALSEAGVTAGAYHLPVWEDTPEAFVPLLSQLFQFTPPTALILTRPYQVSAAYAFLSDRRLRVPGDLSLAVLASDASFSAIRPSLCCMDGDPEPLMRGVMRWVRKGPAPGAKGETTLVPGTLVLGGSLGPTPKGK